MTRRRVRQLTLCPDRLLPDQRARVRLWVQRKYPTYERGLGNLWSSHRDHHLAAGNLGLDWEASFRTWIRRAVEFDQRSAANGDKIAAARLRPQLELLTGGGE